MPVGVCVCLECLHHTVIDLEALFEGILSFCHMHSNALVKFREQLPISDMTHVKKDFNPPAGQSGQSVANNFFQGSSTYTFI